MSFFSRWRGSKFNRALSATARGIIILGTQRIRVGGMGTLSSTDATGAWSYGTPSPRPIHPDIVAKARRTLLRHEATLTDDQKALWGEVYQRVGPEDIFLLLGCLSYIRHGATRETMERYMPDRNYTLPITGDSHA